MHFYHRCIAYLAAIAIMGGLELKLFQARSSVGSSTTLTWWGSLVRVQSRLPG